MQIEKNMKASDIAFYKKMVLSQMTEEGGTFAAISGTSLVLFVAVPKIRREELDGFNYRTKRMGYITDNNGMISIITDNILATEIFWYPYPELREIIEEGITDMFVILIDSKKDKVLSVKLLVIPETIQQKLQEQWLLSIEKGITFNQYQRWVDTTLNSHTCDYNSSIAADKQVVKEFSNVFLYLSSEDEDEKIS